MAMLPRAGKLMMSSKTICPMLPRWSLTPTRCQKVARRARVFHSECLFIHLGTPLPPTHHHHPHPTIALRNKPQAMKSVGGSVHTAAWRRGITYALDISLATN